MTARTVVVTANVLRSLPQHEAGEALSVVLEARPDLVGLQEWDVRRRRLLTGANGEPSLGSGYVWAAPILGECPVGARADRFDLVEYRARGLAWFGRSDPGARPVPIVPLRLATVALFGDRARSATVSVVNYHLTPGVQARGDYRADRPRLVRRHRHEVLSLERLVGEQLAQGHVVYAMGDSNFDGFRLPGLRSAWEGRESQPGTLGSHRKIDDVHGRGPADAVTLLSTASDHKAVVVTRSDVV
jgi:endonuclease/exonuclease/phosphatase family metal-dependent hydrolase